MRTPCFLSVFILSVALTSHAEETDDSSIRHKMNAAILESFPWSPSPESVADEGSSKEVVEFEESELGPTIILDPMVVSRSKHIRELANDLARKEQERREERFSGLNGGTIGRLGILQLGGWGSADGSWVFLRLRKTQTLRQLKLSQDRLKELWDFKAQHQKYTKKLNQSDRSRD